MSFSRNNYSQTLSLVFMPLLGIAVVGQLYLLIPAMTILSTYLGVSYSSISMLTTIFGACYASSLLLWGLLSDRFGRKAVMLLGMTGLVAITLLIAIAQDYSQLLWLRAAQGFFASAFPPLAIAWLSENLSDKNRGRGIAWLSGGFIAASILGQWVGEVMITQNLTNMMYLSSATYLLGGLLILPLTERKRAAPSNELAMLLTVPKALVHGQLLPFYLISLFIPRVGIVWPA